MLFTLTPFPTVDSFSLSTYISTGFLILSVVPSCVFFLQFISDIYSIFNAFDRVTSLS